MRPLPSINENVFLILTKASNAGDIYVFMQSPFQALHDEPDNGRVGDY